MVFDFFFIDVLICGLNKEVKVKIKMYIKLMDEAPYLVLDLVVLLLLMPFYFLDMVHIFVFFCFPFFSLRPSIH